jgi:hypothetical protein
MGAEVDMWVEVEFVEYRWVKSYGVTKEDAILNAHKFSSLQPTGQVSYDNPWEGLSSNETD